MPKIRPRGQLPLDLSRTSFALFHQAEQFQGLLRDDFTGALGQIRPGTRLISALFVGLFGADISARIIAQRYNEKVLYAGFFLYTKADLNQDFTWQPQNVNVSEPQNLNLR